MQLTISAENAIELKNKVLSLAAIFAGSTTSQSQAVDETATNTAPLLVANSGATAEPEADDAPWDTTKKTRTRRTKAQIAADEAAAAAGPKSQPAPAAVASAVTATPATASAAPALTNLAPTTSVPTADAVRTALQSVDKKGGTPAVIALLKSFGCNRLSEVTESKRAEFIEACQKAAA